MRASWIAPAVAMVLASGAAPMTVRSQESGPEAASSFVHGLAGEWSVVTEAVLGPGQDPIRTESQESARVLGDRWLVAESTGTNALGGPHASVLTLGYDAVREGFFGTWIDNMQGHMWTYSGGLDGSGTTLTLETEGPLMGDRSTTARYRVVIELAGRDRKVMRSQILGPDGEWFEFSRAEYRRRM